MINPRNSSLVVVDLETSGINPFRNDVLAVGLVPLFEDVDPLEIYVKPESIEWNKFAQENFQKYASKWKEYAVPPLLACDLIDRYLSKVYPGKRATPVGHNIGFDVSFLKKLAFLGGRDEFATLSHRAIDTHTILYLLFLEGKVPSSALSSDGAFDFFGIQVSDTARHTAIGDALATKELLLRLLHLLDIQSESFAEG